MIPFRTIPFLTPALSRLAQYFGPHKGKLLLAVLFMLLSSAASSLIALLLGKMTDSGFYEVNPEVVLAAPIGLIIVAGMNGLGMLASNWLLGNVSESVAALLRKELFGRMLHWPPEVYKRNPVGLVSSKFINEANFMLTCAAKSAVVLVRDSMQVVGLSVVLIYHNWLLALIVLVLAPVVALLFQTISKKVKSVLENSQENLASLIIRVKETCDAECLIKMSGTRESEQRRFTEVNSELSRLALRINRITSFSTPVTQLIGMCGVAVVLAIALYQTQTGLLTFGEFVTFLAAMLLLLQPLKRLAGVNTTLITLTVAAESLFRTLDEPQEADEGKLELANVTGSITFEHVSFRYPGAEHNAVSDFHLDVRPGERIALVGLSGSGKTSVVNMIPRFLNPTDGRILIDGIDTQTVTLSSLRAQISLVSQDVFLFDGTLRENIAYDLPNIPEEALQNAVERAALGDFVSSLEKGLDTPVGEAGRLLSGGQKQRIAIARAFLRDTPILILDEATSALDSESEAIVHSSLESLMHDRTTFIVAHRLSTVRTASRIVVMEKSVVREIGTHDELLARSGLYAQLTKLQTL